MRVLLIAPIKLTGLKESKGTIPVPLIHLAAILKKHGHEPSILDFSTLSAKLDTFNCEWAQNILEEKINQEQPDLVGINCFKTLHFPFTQKISEIIKSLRPSLPIVLGGTHPSLFPKEILEHIDSVDYIVIGVGEI